MSELEQAALKAIDVLKMCIYERPENYLAIDAVNALENALEKSNAWQPIETAPHDGSKILTCGYLPEVYGYSSREENVSSISYWVSVGYPSKGGWVSQASSYTRRFEPTLWMPLPAPPETDK